MIKRERAWSTPGASDDGAAAWAKDLADAQASADPLVVLAFWTDTARWATETMREAVVVARQSGATWEQIGKAMGTSKQTAWASFAREERGPMRRAGQDPLPGAY